MALLALHFSERYKEKPLNGKKRHTFVDYPLHLTPGQVLLVYLSKSGDVEDSEEAIRIGAARVTKTFIIRVKDIDDNNSKLMGHKSREETLKSMKKWYKIDDSSIVTYIEFELIKK